MAGPRIAAPEELIWDTGIVGSGPYLGPYGGADTDDRTPGWWLTPAQFPEVPPVAPPSDVNETPPPPIDPGTYELPGDVISPDAVFGGQQPTPPLDTPLPQPLPPFVGEMPGDVYDPDVESGEIIYGRDPIIAGGFTPEELPGPAIPAESPAFPLPIPGSQGWSSPEPVIRESPRAPPLALPGFSILPPGFGLVDTPRSRARGRPKVSGEGIGREWTYAFGLPIPKIFPRIPRRLPRRRLPNPKRTPRRVAPPRRLPIPSPIPFPAPRVPSPRRSPGPDIIPPVKIPWPPPRPTPRPVPRPPAPEPVPRTAPPNPIPPAPSPTFPTPRTAPLPQPGPARAPAPAPSPSPSPMPRPMPRPFVQPWPFVFPFPRRAQPDRPYRRFVNPLTPNRDPGVGLNPLPALNPARERDDDCNCNENEPWPSNVVARVKSYGRRMSQWSLDNLNRGTKRGPR